MREYNIIFSNEKEKDIDKNEIVTSDITLTQ